MLAIAAALTLTLAGCGGSEEPIEPGPSNTTYKTVEADRDSGRTTIAVIPKGTTHVFWQTVKAGAESAAEESTEIDMIWKGPVNEDDRAQQIALMQQFITDGVDGIVLAPLDYKALRGPVQAAMDKNIPVVIFDSALEGEPGTDFVSFVATNNGDGGRMAGEYLASVLEENTDVILFRYLAASASTTEREQGFLAAVNAREGMDVIVENRFAGATIDEAKSSALNMIDQIREAGGVFCPNESATMGMLLALRQSNLAGEIRFVGFDASPKLVDALRSGEIDALVVQDPRRMGRIAVDTLLAHLRGEDVEPFIDTGVVLVTRDNMNEANVKRLIE